MLWKPLPVALARREWRPRLVASAMVAAVRARKGLNDACISPIIILSTRFAWRVALRLPELDAGQRPSAKHVGQQPTRGFWRLSLATASTQSIGRARSAARELILLPGARPLAVEGAG